MKYPIQDHNILGKPLDSKQHYTIVGAGVSGLMLGYFLKKRGISFDIFEASDQPGGLIRTHYVEGLGQAEQAANGFLWCDEIAAMSEDMGLTILAADTASKARYLVRNGQLSRFPLGIGESLAMLPKFLLPHRQHLSTVEDFGQTFFGNTFTRQVLEPAFAGIYGANIQDLSFRAVLPAFAEQLNHTHSLPTALWRWRKKRKNASQHPSRISGTLSFKEGFGQFPIRLADYLEQHIHYNKKVTTLPEGNSILTLPAHQAAHFFEGELAQILQKVQYTPIITTTVFVKKEDVPLFKPGFGCLIPRSEGMVLLGILFNSCIFPNRVDDPNILSFTCIFRDDTGEWMQQDETTIMNQVILADMEKLLGLQQPPLGYKMFKWEKGIPLYDNALADSWQKLATILQQEYPQTRLLGNYSGQISVRGMAQFMGQYWE